MDVPDPKKNQYFKLTDDKTRNIQESEENLNSTIEQFQAVWCGGTVQNLSELCPDAQSKPVRIPLRKGNVLAIPSFLPHSEPSVPASQESVLMY